MTLSKQLENSREPAEGLWAVRPQDIQWDEFAYVRSEIGSRASSIARAYLAGAEVKRIHVDNNVLIAARTLREVLYRPGKGTWLSITLKVTPKGDGWEASYNYDDRPHWELGEPSADTYAQELYLFPRDEEHIPDWFKEEMKGATWTPDSD
ncbi:hypothetical protein J3A64_000260 [Pseudarthrobacter sp. PvP004]|uniref:hypothetical protein n=1 Tax=Pseudarthrobacter sp. PvP004 TaxID=2817850 RepID=UPI00257053BF|nr:hypothetical protein [Pseudarthrobacter sp. PvP004]MBP2264796.1 hypothetical protein [Pseudarthrobacter sp. PvP004]